MIRNKVPPGSMRKITAQNIPREFKREYKKNLAIIMRNSKPFGYIQKVFRCEVGHHEEYYVDYECSFAADCINTIKPKRIVDIGSHRHFIIGLLAHYNITSIDIRKKKIRFKNETAITCDAKRIPLESNFFDLVLSLSSIEHFGLGRYGDDFDLSGDKKAIAEFKRILKPNGHVVFSVPITRGEPFIAFNAHRVYTCEMIQSFYKDLELVKRRCYSFELNDFCSLNEITDKKNKWDVYLGCFKK